GHVSIQTTERYLGCKQRIRAEPSTIASAANRKTQSRVSSPNSRQSRVGTSGSKAPLVTLPVKGLFRGARHSDAPRTGDAKIALGSSGAYFLSKKSALAG